MTLDWLILSFDVHSTSEWPPNEEMMPEWQGWKPPILATFLSNDPGMTHFSHSDIIPSFQDEDEWDDVDHFPLRETSPLQFLSELYASIYSGLFNTEIDVNFCVTRKNSNPTTRHLSHRQRKMFENISTGFWINQIYGNTSNVCFSLGFTKDKITKTLQELQMLSPIKWSQVSLGSLFEGVL